MLGCSSLNAGGEGDLSARCRAVLSQTISDEGAVYADSTAVGRGAGGAEEMVAADDEYAVSLRRNVDESGVRSELGHIQPAHVETCIEFYRAFDADGDGVLTPREFVAGLKAYGRATGNPEAYQRRFLLEALAVMSIG